jgi:hypothetical protein
MISLFSDMSMGKPLHFVLRRFRQKSGKIFGAKFETGGLDKSHKKSICIPGRNIRLYLYADSVLLHYIGRESRKINCCIHRVKGGASSAQKTGKKAEPRKRAKKLKKGVAKRAGVWYYT